MPNMLGRDAAAATDSGGGPRGDREGFTVVDSVVGALIVGIIAAIAIFAITTVTHHPATPPKCSNAVADEVAQVHVVIKAYENLHDGHPPAALEDVKMDNLPVPKTSLSHDAGFVYNRSDGSYTGPCGAS